MPPFADKSSLQAAAQEYNTDVTAATYKYGPIASWDVSAITNMSYLFSYASHFNADVSSWDTSSVTTMAYMFMVRSVRPPPPPWPATLRSWLSPCTLLAPPPLPPMPSRLLLAPHAVPLSPRPPLATRQGAAAFNQSLSLDTSNVTTMVFMFSVRSARAPLCQQPPQLAPSLHAACAAATAPPRPPDSPPAPHAAPSLHALPLPLGRARMCSTSR